METPRGDGDPPPCCEKADGLQGTLQSPPVLEGRERRLSARRENRGRPGGSKSPEAGVATDENPATQDGDEVFCCSPSPAEAAGDWTDVSGDMPEGSDWESDADGEAIQTRFRSGRKDADVNLSLSGRLLPKDNALRKAQSPGLLTLAMDVDDYARAIPVLSPSAMRKSGRLRLGPSRARGSTKDGRAVAGRGASGGRLQSSFSAKRLHTPTQRSADILLDSKRAQARGEPDTQKENLVGHTQNCGGDSRKEARLKHMKPSLYRPERERAARNRRRRQRAIGGGGLDAGGDEAALVHKLNLKERARDYADELFDRMGLLAADEDFLYKEMERDALLLDYDDYLFEDDDDEDDERFFLGGAAANRFFLSQDGAPLCGLLNDDRVIDLSDDQESRAGQDMETEEEAAATRTIVRQMFSSLGVTDWAAFLQLQAEFWLYNSAHRQALITARAAERVLQEGGPDLKGHQEAKARPLPHGSPSEPSVPSRDAERIAPPPADSPGGTTRTLAVKMVAACALREFGRSSEYLRQLRGRDLAALSEPLEAYVEEAVRFLAERTADPVLSPPGSRPPF
ncbi:hypothetical protein BESB_007410 [Besnoitia besnoiti]|uniref:Uncharacterized protein n=1 Tax=Besnoitia besnoiti TaxID=94643 RepID=A0A2A9MKE3_BESBE|nr:hypothetical protein BESB_007410 [Besnoitia besnoiti]PFH38399.1 hypothetical protein BESB_007410 [Besnoitia besnoiti]